jgi:hypothetical protein
MDRGKSMPLPLKHTQTVAELASLLYGFLAGSGFSSAADRVGMGRFWSGGSKEPAIQGLLIAAYEQGSFTKLMVEIVSSGIKYRMRQGDPITRETLLQLNKLVQALGFKVPELWDQDFLGSLPSARPSEPEPSAAPYAGITPLREAFANLQQLEPHQRGFAFERFLKDLFDHFHLDPRASFRIVGEQIDGSFDFEKETYLLEAKWQDKLTDEADLLVLHGKTIGKAQWARGLFVSYSGFSPDGLEAFGRGKPTNIVGMTGQDLHFILDGRLALPEALHAKVRGAAETGRFYIPVYEMPL